MTADIPSRPARVLVADDDEDHVYLMRLAFEQSRLRMDLQHVHDGVECMRYLRRESPFENAARPDLLLLDLNMPRMNGAEVMAAVLADERLRSLPVVVLSTSSELIDINRMYGLRCSSYMVKPVDFDKFVAMVRQLSGYWLELVKLPDPEAPPAPPRGT